MMLFIVSLLFITAAMALMAVGVLLGRKPLKGGCGRGNDCRCEGEQ
jgi:hypothetical protein